MVGDVEERGVFEVTAAGRPSRSFPLILKLPDRVQVHSRVAELKKCTEEARTGGSSLSSSSIVVVVVVVVPAVPLSAFFLPPPQREQQSRRCYHTVVRSWVRPLRSAARSSFVLSPTYTYGTVCISLVLVCIWCGVESSRMSVRSPLGLHVLLFLCTS